MILKPAITEKSMLSAQKKQYTFFVELGASKNQIREAIEEAFGVHVQSVKTTTVKGKQKRSGRSRKLYTKADLKKAVITVGEKESIDIFDTEEKKETKKKK